MTKDNSFRDYIVHDVLRDIPGVTTRNMFGGCGIYKNGKMFGIIEDGEVYFKIGDRNRKDFENMNSHPFTYEREGKEVSLSYWLVPEEFLEDKYKIRELVEKSS